MDLDFIDNGDDDNASQQSFHTANDSLDSDNSNESSFHLALTYQETSDQEEDGIWGAFRSLFSKYPNLIPTPSLPFTSSSPS
ncbi:uncharacterized protein Triagg1_8702 [Trichoderma aggressivum f. europaeum]|uniref:Uncharacterized protein n=1 Tax=Trichoderma aggressivum f. europaeum TaxID=173218 RepID=A0AAE1I9L5_9HYPO|nr:hypothetical protein Triagg1_8702 [Trichoderma aggressivum f. europaeum]